MLCIFIIIYKGNKCLLRRQRIDAVIICNIHIYVTGHLSEETVKGEANVGLKKINILKKKSIHIVYTLYNMFHGELTNRRRMVVYLKP